ncbi:MAG: YicC family protein [Melioribacteraceae bacterium]|nr:YicC family protein [Melioribacteraceae bacterium]MCF8353279.1 YicC family protein [Melioribacteraceae bacterium]MCF8394835.1 YicC family protein [Melioribacteraceae bacterium]MCF8418806.1 YicC family protein [Melioribacteraceae bacterium]
MIYSMTGYGKGATQISEFIIEAEIKTLNSRYLDIFIKLPKSFQDKEFEIREVLKRKLKRGKINLSVNIKKDGFDNGKIAEISEEGLKNTFNLLNKIKSETNISDEIKLDHILLFNHLIFTDSILDPEKDFHFVLDAIDTAVNDLIEMRKKEGAELSADLNERVNNILQTVSEIESLVQDALNDYYYKLRERAKQLMGELGEYDDRLKMELALLTDRSDVTEECVRLKSHIKLFLDTLKNSDEAGRKLNFISQEMNREANTINSKSISSEISHRGIFIKEELEKIREQIQNIE